MAAKSPTPRRAAAKAPAARKRASAPPSQTPILEWIAAGLGLLMMMNVIGLLIAQGLASNDDAQLSARIVERNAAEIKIEVVNKGAAAASAVEVEGAASGGSGTVTIDYVPGRSSRIAVLVIDGPGPVIVRVKGYTLP